MWVVPLVKKQLCREFLRSFDIFLLSSDLAFIFREVEVVRRGMMDKFCEKEKKNLSFWSRWYRRTFGVKGLWPKHYFSSPEGQSQNRITRIKKIKTLSDSLPLFLFLCYVYEVKACHKAIV